MAPNKLYEQIPRHRYLILRERYDHFLDTLNDSTKDVVRIFDPLSPKQLDELKLIREVSEELQMKKEEDMKKAAQAAEEASKAEAEAKEVAEKEESEKEESEAKDEKESEEKVEQTTETTDKVEN